MEANIPDYMMVKDAARAWDITERRVIMYLADGRIPGAVKVGNTWLIPKGAVKPTDGRKNNSRRSKAETPKAGRDAKSTSLLDRVSEEEI